MLSVRTYMAKPEDMERKWYLVDASGKRLGRLASQVASILRGKHKPIFTPHVDVGDFVVVINASKLVLTGKKLDKKIYYRHSGYPGGLREIPYRILLERNPVKAFELAVRRMLPKNSLGRKMFKKLKVYAGPDHPHQAQKPEPIDLG